MISLTKKQKTKTTQKLQLNNFIFLIYLREIFTFFLYKRLLIFCPKVYFVNFDNFQSITKQDAFFMRFTQFSPYPFHPQLHFW